MKKRKKKLSALQKAIIVVGGPSELSRLVGVKKQAVYGWEQAGRVPYLRVLDVERVTGISRYDLAPEVCGEPPTGWQEQLEEIRSAIVEQRCADASALWGD